MQKWALFTLLLATTVFGAKTTPTSQLPKEEEPDIHLFRPENQVYSSHVEFLYWKAFTTGLIFAQKMTEPSWTSNAPGPVNDAVMGNYKTSQFNIDPGFRVSQSFFRAHRFWEVWGSYTRLTSRGKNSLSAPTGPGLFLTAAWPLPLMGPLNHAKSSLHLNYNVADFYVDRYFNPNPHLRMRMIAGITGTWLTHNWTIKYFDIAQQTARIRSTWNFWGCGLRFGMSGDWFWEHDFYLTVRATLAGLVGPYHNRTFQTTNVIDPAVDSRLPVRHAGYRDTRAVGNLQLIIGPSWQKNWCKPRIRTELFVGYEFNGWFNLQEVYHSTLGAASDPKETWINNGAFGLQGLTARFTIDY